MKQLFQRAIIRLRKPARCSFKIVAGVICATAIGMVVWDNLQALGNIAGSTNSDVLGGQILQSTSVLAGISEGELDMSSIASQLTAAAIGTLMTIIAAVLWPDAEWMVPWGAER